MTDSWGQPPQQQGYPPQQQQGWGQPPQQQGYPPQQQGWGPPPQQPAYQQPPALPTVPEDTVEDFFAQAGGGPGAPGFKFQNVVGHGVLGLIVAQRQVWKTRMTATGNQEIQYDKNGNPLKQLEVTLQTNLRNWQDVSRIPTVDDGRGGRVELPGDQDTGLRRIYLWYTLRDAVVDAVQVSGQQHTNIGWELGVKVTGQRPNPQGGNPIREYAAIHRPPTGAITAAPTAPAAPPVPAPPAQQPPQQQGYPPAQQPVPPAPQGPPPGQPMPPSSPWGAAPPQQPGYAQPPTPNPGYPDEPPF